MRDPYAVLGVAKSADEKEIKSAFRKLAKAHHPDANANDPKAAARFNEVNQAYEILGDKEKRAQFDRGEIDAEGKPRFQGFAGGDPFGAGGSPFGGGRRRSSGGFNFGGGSAGGYGNEGVFSDIFEQAFGGRGASGFTAARQAASKGEDLRADLVVRLEDVVRGEKVEAKFPNGRRLAISLPDGVEDGQTIRLKGQGQPAPVAGAPAGDALITIRFTPHPRFRVEGRNLVQDLDIPLEIAVLGGKVEVETLTGRIALTIPARTDSGRTFRLRGKGLSTRTGGRGDLLATVRIVLPKDLDALERFLNEEARSEPAAG